ncbi:MAG: class I SAM-dependent methyltransferase [Streptosporangiaceae bacterium]|nr:class I SAM-dependent methyltransferase [Pseudonocardiales bacterium]MBV9446857.1 class I SAM-dependent methyltransferase [Streptosporangiaceae bacterium]
MSDLDALGRTALIPFWARVHDALLPSPILGDHAAAALAPEVERRFGAEPVGDATRVGCCLRNRAMDEWIADLAANGNSGVRTVVDIGVGLDTRLRRRPQLAEHYVEVDGEAIMNLRDDLLPGTGAVRVRADGMSVDEWIDAVDHQVSSVTVLVLEGVLAYQDPSRVSRFFADAARCLPGAFVVFDNLSPLAAWPANRPAALAQGRPRYVWSPWFTRRIPAGSQRLRILQERGFGDFPRDLTREFSNRNRIVYSLPPMRRAYRLTLARLPD